MAKNMNALRAVGSFCGLPFPPSLAAAGDDDAGLALGAGLAWGLGAASLGGPSLALATGGGRGEQGMKKGGQRRAMRSGLVDRALVEAARKCTAR